jgi:tetratricopeptide (TPR) repeat protein
MTIFVFALGVVILVFLALIMKSVSTLLHEFGHAIPALLLTKQPVTVYLGSYGNMVNSVRVSTGRLTIWFRYKPAIWITGVCIAHQQDISLNRRLIFILCGPVASMMLAAASVYLAFSYEPFDLLKVLLILLLGCALFDVFANLLPNKKPIQLADGGVTFNDGQQLLEILALKKLPADYLKAFSLYQSKNYDEAAAITESWLQKHKLQADVLRLAIATTTSTGQYEKALQLHEKLKQNCKLVPNDYNALALIFCFLNRHEESMAIYIKSLEVNPHDYFSLNNCGYLLNCVNRFQEAMPYLEKAISLQPQIFYAYNNLGLAKIKLGDVENGLALINKSLELDPDNTYAFRNLGIYYLDLGDTQEALKNFTRSKNLNKYTHLLDSLIEDAMQRQGAAI